MAVRQRLTEDDALDRVRTALGERLVEAKLSHGHVDITVEPGNLLDAVTILRDDIALECRFFTFLSAIDRSTFKFEGRSQEEGEERASGLEVLIHLYSPEKVLHVNIHVPLDLESPVCPSITGLYAGAEWHERETSEMFGIYFSGHPNLVHLYLPEDFEGHPLLKSFKLPARSFVKDWPGAKDPDEAAAGGR